MARLLFHHFDFSPSLARTQSLPAWYFVAMDEVTVVPHDPPRRSEQGRRGEREQRGREREVVRE